ncbi:MAG: hypothetical protein GOU99_03250 [Candidatus Altiarchaeota archaeon]|nr:hypothetical protein [Candidatus Altiarchaeota archaeon]
MLGVGIAFGVYGKITGRYEPFLVYMGIVMSAFMISFLNYALYKSKY